MDFPAQRERTAKNPGNQEKARSQWGEIENKDKNKQGTLGGSVR